MKKQLLPLLFSVFLFHISSAQVISIIGNTSPSGSWDIDTNMITSDNITYTLNNVILTTATGSSTGLKFRQDASWATNWGGNFPNGTGQLDGANIQTIAGTYDITFNRVNSTYTFILVAGFPSIGIWGPAVDSQNGYAGPDVNMATNDGISYTLSGFIFSSGNAYFRQDDNSTIVWGSTSFPTGTAVPNGPSLSIPGGEYFVTFNRTTGAYSFSFPSIGILGTGLNGFDVPDTDLSTNDGFTYIINDLNLTNGLVKFRKDNSWDTNWGSADFPNGTGTQNGENIPVTAGLYSISFDRSTGDYQFLQLLNSNEFASGEFKIYPNPSNQNWTISSKEPIESIQLIDILGKTIENSKPNSYSYLIDGTALNGGMYFVKVETTTGSTSLKLIKN